MTTTINPDLSLAGSVSVVQGSVADWPIQLADADGTTPSYDSGDTVAAVVFAGSGLAALFAPAASWTGGTGYSTGQVTVSPLSASTALLEAGGDYQLQVWWTSQDATRTACVGRRQLIVLPAAGGGSETVTTYNALADMLQYAPWLQQVAGQDTDFEGFYKQRLQARNWFDWAVINNYRGASVGNFEFMSTLAFAFGGGVGWRRGVGPSPSMVSWLSEDLLIIRPQVIEACAYKSIAQVGLAQIGVNAQQASFGAYFRDLAERTMTAITAEIDLNADGIGEIFVNLGSTNTLMT